MNYNKSSSSSSSSCLPPLTLESSNNHFISAIPSPSQNSLYDAPRPYHHHNGQKKQNNSHFKTKLAIGTQLPFEQYNKTPSSIKIISPNQPSGSSHYLMPSAGQKRVFNFYDIGSKNVMPQASLYSKISSPKSQQPQQQMITSTNALNRQIANRRSTKQDQKRDAQILNQFIRSLSTSSPSQKSAQTPPPTMPVSKAANQIKVLSVSSSESKAISDTRSKQNSQQASTVAISQTDKTLIEDLKENLQRKVSGQKRGRKTKKFSEYCEHTENRITQLTEQLKDASLNENDKFKIRNQISAYQARIKAKVQNMDKEIKFKQAQDQIQQILSIAHQFVPSDKIDSFYASIRQSYPDVEL